MWLQEDLTLGAQFCDEPRQFRVGSEERAKYAIERPLALQPLHNEVGGARINLRFHALPHRIQGHVPLVQYPGNTSAGRR